MNDSEDVSTESSAVSFEISANSTTTSSLSKVQVASMGVNSIGSKTLTLNHHVFENGDWKLRLAQPHPTVWLMVATECSDYEEFGFNRHSVSNHGVQAIVDSGAQCCLWGWSDCKAAGFRQDDLLPVKQKLSAVSWLCINIYGAVILWMTGVSPSAKEHPCAAIVYVSPIVSGFYLSKEAMIQLQIVPVDFPTGGGALSSDVNATHSDYAINTAINGCGCPRRTMPPGLPAKLPFECNPKNVDKMKQWLLKRYGSSSFNTCPHQILPDMQGPPVSIHVNSRATPVAVHVPAQIPLHWQEKVEDDLKRDESLGVIERVPHGETSTWCHRMVNARKEDGNPRRTVDLSPLNKHCVSYYPLGPLPLQTCTPGICFKWGWLQSTF